LRRPSAEIHPARHATFLKGKMPLQLVAETQAAYADLALGAACRDREMRVAAENGAPGSAEGISREHPRGL
jgi:hypothetical protein